MGSLTDYGENIFIGHLCSSEYTPATAVYLALCTADPTDPATGLLMHEVPNANGYARSEISFGSASSRRITQNMTCTFPTATGSWGVVTHWGIVVSGDYGAGSVLAYGAFNSSFSPISGNVPRIVSGQVYVEISSSSGSGFTTYFSDKMLDLMFKHVTYPQPSTYVALLNQEGADSDTTVAAKEVSGVGYARVLVSKAGGSSPSWNSVSGGVADNKEVIAFPSVGVGGWSEIVGVAIVDGTNMLAYSNDWIVNQTAVYGDVVQFLAGNLDIMIS